ncbi:MAG: hypothetical protein IJ012_01100 [Clostridia bacterium]|nr:hypothetical protein [Clostridia bacterium]
MSKKILSLFLALTMLVLAVPVLALAATAEDANILTETWDGGATTTFTADSRKDSSNILTFYQWYKADGTPLAHWTTNDVAIDEDIYATVNPALIAAGHVKADATYEEQVAQYKEYLATCGLITYAGNWSVGTYVDGNYEQIDRRLLIFQAASMYGVRRNSKGVLVLNRTPFNSSYLGTASAAKKYFDEYFENALTFVQPGEDGKLYFTEIKDVFETSGGDTWGWTKGEGVVQYSGNSVLENGDPAFNLRVPNTGGSNGLNGVAFGYTVPAGVFGTAKISIESIKCYSAETGPAYFAIAVNDKGVWPAGVEIANTATYASLSEGDTAKLNEQLASLTFDVQAGDVVSLVLVRNNKITVDMRPTITIDKKCAVEVQDKDGNVLLTEVVEPGAAFPALPYASENGFYVNGATEPVTELPATVTENLTVKYAGDFKIDEITLAKTDLRFGKGLSIDLYLKADAYAVEAGVATEDGTELRATKQEDGSFKITLTDIPVLEMGEDITVFPFQDFADGNSVPGTELTVNPVALLGAPEAGEEAICTAMLDYVAAAEAYFNGTTLDAEVEARLAAQDAAIEALAKDITKEGEGDFTVARATLVLKDTVALKIGVEMTELTELTDNDLALTVMMDGEEISGFKMQQGSGKTAMVITLNSVKLSDFDKAIEIVVMDGFDEISDTLTYSVNTYIARTFEGGEGETDNLLRALYALGVAANA